ncbi:Centaurin-gamma-1A [Cryptotermes secundus]|uniref:Centaurin-gamma-1A n=1 Tax=Cryptotermes secundus TaxID=105785 RepID=A0A2J7QUF1_9NEOP|nr:centaurin-gamma-1A isoform X2 [Cryptotermes secundus]PNF32214.1 Centaurin-gamma-1A [Cryptotermes secundus]
MKLPVAESFLRSIKRRSLRVKRSKSLVIEEKRKSDSFVNSQEWTLSRGVPDLRLGIVGSLSSGKSALVHRYLTGSYMQEESPEGGRFKKEIVVDGQSYLLLIRDEGGPPELQFTAWVDAVIFVFSLENEASFNAIYTYYTKMAHFRNSAEIPLILVGTQDAISENNPRLIDDSRARKLATDLKRCSYYETCATYGLNVERVFQDACQKIVQQRLSTSTSCLTPTNSRPSTPNNHFSAVVGGASRHHQPAPSPTNNGFLGSGTTTTTSSSSPHTSGGSPASNVMVGNASPSHTQTLSHKEASSLSGGRQVHTLSSSNHHIHRHQQDTNKLDSTDKWGSNTHVSGTTPSSGAAIDNNNVLTKFVPPQNFDNLPPPQPPGSKDKDLPTPSSTPTTSRKSRRRSNLFTPSKKGDDKMKNGELGSGRAIPIKQGYLYKRSSKALNKDWKKKYVTLCDDGRLTYHPSLHDYMDDVHGKEISLQYVTVKVPGQKPRGSKSIMGGATAGNNGISDGLASLTITSFQGKEKRVTDKVLLTAFELLKDSGARVIQAPSNEDAMIISNNTISSSLLNGTDGKIETPNVKKRHRRMKSSGMKNTECDDSDGYEFFIVSLDNKQWHFEAGNSEERDEWVSAIEQQILNSLQANESSKAKSRLNSSVDTGSIQAIRSRVPGNSHCADCDAANPDWASLNLGVLMCIECSGIHRNLGSHISRVRSLDLDEWPPGHLSVMLSIGNSLANSVWECNSHGRAKPTPNSSREEKERWIRSKYESKEFLAPVMQGVPLGQQLVDAVCRSDMKSIVLLLAHATMEHVSSCVSVRDLRTPLHLACAMGNLPVAQLLIWHNANVKAIDHEGRTCLAYARAASSLALSKSSAGGGGSSGGPCAELNAAATSSLVELLLANGCPEVTSGTLPRRRGSVGRRSGGDGSVPPFDKLPSSVI